ncbi:Uncharacterised protein [Bordetella pertussis]|nr:Uncharacterised protein [Bordetella pertussis]
MRAALLPCTKSTMRPKAPACSSWPGPGALGDPGLVSLQPCSIAQPQVLVRDALRTGQQRIGELLGLQVGVAPHVLEPFRRVARRVLYLQHFHAAHVFVVLQRAAQVAAPAVQAARQLDGVFQGQLGARADGKVRRVGRVAHQHHRHVALAARRLQAVPAHPMRTDHAREADPDGRAAYVLGVADQAVAVQPEREQPLAIGNAVFLAHALDAGGLPGFLGRLDDERGQPVLEAIGMGLEPAVFILHEGEREGVEYLGRAQPDEAAAALVDIGGEGVSGCAPRC